MNERERENAEVWTRKLGVREAKLVRSVNQLTTERHSLAFELDLARLKLESAGATLELKLKRQNSS